MKQALVLVILLTVLAACRPAKTTKGVDWKPLKEKPALVQKHQLTK